MGLIGFIIAGLLAIIMSTADTELNAVSIALVHDVIKRLRITTKINEVRLASIVTIIIGIVAIILSMQFKSILDAMLFTSLLWYPVMSCPLILGIYGLKSNDKAFILSTGITALGVIIIHNVWSHNFALSTLCGITLNSVLFALCHYCTNNAHTFSINRNCHFADIEDTNTSK